MHPLLTRQNLYGGQPNFTLKSDSLRYEATGVCNFTGPNCSLPKKSHITGIVVAKNTQLLPLTFRLLLYPEPFFTS